MSAWYWKRFGCMKCTRFCTYAGVFLGDLELDRHRRSWDGSAVCSKAIRKEPPTLPLIISFDGQRYTEKHDEKS